MILTGDIGGSKTNLALFSFSENQLKIIDVERYASREIVSLEDTISKFLNKNNLWQSAKIKIAWFSVAAPLVEDILKMPNLDLEISRSRIKNSLAFIPTIGWCNDLVALGRGISVLPDAQLLKLNKSAEDCKSDLPLLNKAIIAPGTGLGESIIIKGEVHPTEGGHADFAPSKKEDLLLWQYLHQIYGHVSYERILSGKGILNIYSYLRNQSKTPEKYPGKLSPEEISAKALINECPVCCETLHTFVRILGAEAGNLALKALALGGIYIGGGIAPKIKSKLSDATFIEAFCNKGRFSPMLRNIPVCLILEERTPLLGAALLGLKKLGVHGSFSWSP